MADTTFVDGTVIEASWLNDVNDLVYSNTGTINVLVQETPAVGDGVTDDTLAIQTALNTGKDVFLPPGTYLTTQPLVLNTVGQRLYGIPNNTAILADHTNGPVINILQRLCSVYGMVINASDARNAAAVTSTNHGIQIGGESAGTLTATKISQVVVTRQPADGFHMLKEGVTTIFEQAGSQYNRGHGFFFDDGTYDGLSSTTRTGIVTLTSCRSSGDGGNAINLAISGNSAYRFIIDNFEAMNCAWNTNISGLNNSVFYTKGQNIEFRACAAADANYADTTQPNGDTRLAKGTAAVGWYLASFSQNNHHINCRAISLSKTVATGTNIVGIKIDGTYSNTVQTTGFSIGNSCTAVWLNITDSNSYTTPVTTGTGVVGIMYLDGEKYKLVPSTSAGFGLTKTVTAMITSDSLNCLSTTVTVTGEGNLADNLASLNFAGGSVPIPDGLLVNIVNLNAYNITVKHATGNIYTNTAADVTLGQNKAIQFAITNSGKAYQV